MAKARNKTKQHKHTLTLIGVKEIFSGKSIKQTFHMLCFFLYTYFFAANDIFLFNVYWRRQSCLYYYFFHVFFCSLFWYKKANNNNRKKVKYIFVVLNATNNQIPHIKVLPTNNIYGLGILCTQYYSVFFLSLLFCWADAWCPPI